MLEDPSYRPKIFYTSGELKGQEEPVSYIYYYYYFFFYYCNFLFLFLFLFFIIIIIISFVIIK